MRLWELIRLALSGIRRTPLRVTLTSLGVAIAVGALITMVGFGLGVQDQMEEPFRKSELFNRIDVSVRQAGKSTSGQEEANSPQPSESSPGTGPVLDETALGQLRSLPGVTLAYPEVYLNQLEIVRDGKTTSASAAALPREASRLRFVTDGVVAGRFFDRGDSKEAMVGKRLAKNLGFDSPGDAVGIKLTLKAKGLSPGTSRTFTFEERQVDVEVVGVFDLHGFRTGFRPDALLLPLDLIRELPGVQFESALDRLRRGLAGAPLGYTRAVVRVDRPSDLFSVREKIEGMGFQTGTLLGRIDEFRKAFLIMDLVLGAVGTVALVVAGLGIINTLLMAVLERYREIGTYKALGASNGDIRILFLAEAGLVGLLGGIGGLVLGLVVSQGINVVANGIARSRGLDEPVVFFAFPPYLLLGAILFALLVSVLSGVYPASRAARVDPIQALRSE
jgi:putative ABC transport system permease protein